MNVINNNNSFFGKFPLPEVFKHLGPSDLANCRLVSWFFKEAESAPVPSSYAAIAGRIDIPLAQSPGEASHPFSVRAFKVVKDYVLMLNQTIQAYPAEQIPSDIFNILDAKTPPSEEEIKQLEAFVKARDTLVVWEGIASEIEAPIDLSKIWDSSDKVLNEAEKFSNWCQQQNVKQKISNLRVLELKHSQLTSIPHKSLWFSSGRVV